MSERDLKNHTFIFHDHKIWGGAEKECNGRNHLKLPSSPSPSPSPAAEVAAEAAAEAAAEVAAAVEAQEEHMFVQHKKIKAFLTLLFKRQKRKQVKIALKNNFFSESIDSARKPMNKQPQKKEGERVEGGFP